MIWLARTITALNGYLFALAKWLVFAIAALMVYEVIARYSLLSPTSWAPELATLIFGPFFLLGGPYLVHLGGHVAVDIVSDHAKGCFKNGFVLVGLLLTVIFGAVLLWFSLPLAWQSFEYGETSYSSWNPIVWPAKSVLPLAAFLLILQSLAEAIFHLHPREHS